MTKLGNTLGKGQGNYLDFFQCFFLIKQSFYGRSLNENNYKEVLRI